MAACVVFVAFLLDSTGLPSVSYGGFGKEAMAMYETPSRGREVPLVDFRRAHECLRGELLEAVAEVLDSGRYLYGPAVGRLEEAIARYCQVPHAVGCASGSDALLLCLMALGVGPGDEVIVPSFTFFATASAAWRLGARPVFVDLDPKSFNIDPDWVERSITPATRAIIPVHLFGRCAAMDVLCRIAAAHNVPLIEDAAQAIGAEHQGRRAGSWGTAACFSFYPTKNLGGCGDGGMVTTSDEELANRIRILANHGMQPRYVHQYVGINSRLDSIQAAILEVKLRYLDVWTDRRRQNAALYNQLFHHHGLAAWLHLPEEPHDGFHVWNQYTVRVPGGLRDALRQFLAQRGVMTEVYYPIPLHLQSCFRSLGYRAGDLPHTERAAAEVLSLPIHPELTEAEQSYVVEQIAAFAHAHQRAVA